jgi:hypothetical protein
MVLTDTATEVGISQGGRPVALAMKAEVSTSPAGSAGV